MMVEAASTDLRASSGRVPGWLKWGYTLFVLLLVPVYGGMK